MRHVRLPIRFGLDQRLAAGGPLAVLVVAQLAGEAHERGTGTVAPADAAAPEALVLGLGAFRLRPRAIAVVLDRLAASGVISRLPDGSVDVGPWLAPIGSPSTDAERARRYRDRRRDASRSRDGERDASRPSRDANGRHVTSRDASLSHPNQSHPSPDARARADCHGRALPGTETQSAPDGAPTPEPETGSEEGDAHAIAELRAALAAAGYGTAAEQLRAAEQLHRQSVTAADVSVAYGVAARRGKDTVRLFAAWVRRGQLRSVIDEARARRRTSFDRARGRRARAAADPDAPVAVPPPIGRADVDAALQPAPLEPAP